LSCTRQADHRLRLAAAVVASAVIAVTPQPASVAVLLAAALCGCAVAVALGETSVRDVARRLLAVNAFVALVWVTLPWQLTARGWVYWPPGVDLALLITLRANAVAAACLALLAGIDAFGLARAAAGLGLPAKLARLMALTVRYVGLFAETRLRIERACRARGFRARPDRRTLRVTAQMVAVLLMQALLRAERVELALRARGFSGLYAAPARWPRQRQQWAWALATGAALSGAWLLPVWLAR
jgi:cobalt/nickel transport system permease protein